MDTKGIGYAGCIEMDHCYVWCYIDVSFRVEMAQCVLVGAAHILGG